jgi:hypothetical protein
LDSDYTVTGADDVGGGTVTLSVALTGAQSVRIRRKTPKIQPVDFVAQGSFSPLTHARAIDRQMLISQEIDRDAATIEVPGGLIASGTPGPTTFLRGDGAWATPAGGSGSGGGLVDIRAHGAIMDGVTDDSPAVRAALVAGNGAIFIPEGSTYWATVVQTPITGCFIQGAGPRTKIIVPNENASALHIQGPPGGGAAEATTSRSFLRDLAFATPAGVPAAGTTILVEGETQMQGIFIRKCFRGVDVETTVMAELIEIRGYREHAFHVGHTYVTMLTDFVFAAYDDEGGAPIYADDVYGIALVPKGGSDYVESVKCLNGDILFGARSIHIGQHRDPAGDGQEIQPGKDPGANKFTNILCDTMRDYGLVIDVAGMHTFENCWFVNAANFDGAYVDRVKDVRFIGCEFMVNARKGCYVGTGASIVRWEDCTFAHNAQEGLYISAGVSDFMARGCMARARHRWPNGFVRQTQTWGIYLVAGSSDRYIIADNLVSGNATGGVFDGGSGANKRVANNY